MSRYWRNRSNFSVTSVYFPPALPAQPPWWLLAAKNMLNYAELLRLKYK